MGTGQAQRVATEAANDVVTSWEADFLGDPTEDMDAAGFIKKLSPDGKFGQTIKVRIVPAMTSQSVANSASTTLTRVNLTTNNNTDRVVSGTSQLAYGVAAINRNVWNQVRDDAQMRSQYKHQLNRSMGEKIDTDVLANAALLSNVITQPDLDGVALAMGVGRVRKTAKSKAKLGEADYRLWVHPDEVGNAFRIPEIREYQIRGNTGSAATGTPVNVYGIKWDAHGLVYTSGTTAYCPLILNDAWFIAYNETAHALPDQLDGLTDWFIMVAEYATNELFDSSGLAFALTVP